MFILSTASYNIFVSSPSHDYGVFILGKWEAAAIQMRAIIASSLTLYRFVFCISPIMMSQVTVTITSLKWRKLPKSCFTEFVIFVCFLTSKASAFEEIPVYIFRPV